VAAAPIFPARATWASRDYTPRNTSNPGDMIDMPASCGDADVPQGVQCVVMAFSR
jgi:type IV pilus assembly protein PilV